MQLVVGAEDDVAPFTAVAPVGTPFGQVFLPMEADYPRSSFAGFDFYFSRVDEQSAAWVNRRIYLNMTTKSREKVTFY